MTTTLTDDSTLDLGPDAASGLDGDRDPDLAASLAGPPPDLVASIAERDAAHDAAGTYVADCVDDLRSVGWLALPVPTELGGAGASIRTVVERQRALARRAPNTALVTSMHHHVVLTTAWRFRRGLVPAEATLRKVADDGLFVASTGGGDFLAPSGEARAVDGGYLVSGRKKFVSGALSAGAINTWVLDAGSGGAEAMAMGIPTSSDGLRVEETWDAVGMRGTGSHDVVLEDVFVPDAAVAARRPIGALHPSLLAITAHAFPVILSVYLGIAEGARDRAVDLLTERSGALDDAGTTRLVGEIDQQLATADWVLRGLVDELGDDVVPSEEQFVRVMLAKRAVTEAVRTAVDRTMDAVGGAAYSRRLPIERAWRDLRAAPFHPLSGERTLRVAGLGALGGAPLDA